MPAAIACSPIRHESQPAVRVGALTELPRLRPELSPHRVVQLICQPGGLISPQGVDELLRQGGGVGVHHGKSASPVSASRSPDEERSDGCGQL